MSSTDWLIMMSVPDVSHGIVWSGFQRMWSVGPSTFMSLKLKHN